LVLIWTPPPSSSYLAIYLICCHKILEPPLLLPWRNLMINSNTVISNLENGYLEFYLVTGFWVTIASPITCTPLPPHTPHTTHTHPGGGRGSGVAPGFFWDEIRDYRFEKANFEKVVFENEKFVFEINDFFQFNKDP